MKRFITLFMLFAFMLSANLFAQQDLKKVEKQNKKIAKKLKPTVKYAAYFDHSKPLREMIEENKFNAPKDNTFSKINSENEYNPKLTKKKGKTVPDQLAQIQRAFMANKGAKAETLILNDSFDGGANSDNSNLIMPPDTQGDVSPDYYMQAVNNVTVIYDKSGNVVQGPFPTSDFWAGFGIFEDTNDGDAIILWDENAGTNGRWLVSQFAVPASDDNYYELVAISQTDDPTGAYNRYAFEYTYMPDYPKLAVWPDGYYAGFNAFDASNNYSSEGIYASVYERDEMIAGNAARMVNFQDANEFALFPADADDFTNIPAGAPCYFINDQVATYTDNNEVYVWQFHVDWSNTANSTFGSKQTITVSNYGFFGQTNGDGDTQAEQPGTTLKLDMLHYRTMFRAYYRPFSDHNSLLLCRTVDPANDGADADQAGIRWYEFRNTGTGTWSTYQEGTYAPGDGKWRWMPSIAMNANGDIALGYSISDGTSTYPSLAAVARYSTDALGVMTTNEMTLYSGSASQDAGTNYTRWGDYAMVSVDPSDNYSFWFTSEYTTGGWDWRTRITHFSLPVLNPPTVTAVSPSSLYEDRGKQLTITGSDLSGATFDIGGVTGTAVSNDGSTAVVNFPAGNYSDGTLTVTNSSGSDNSQSVTINTRNIIPVVSGAGVTDDNHPTIQSALDGLFAWYGTTSFGAGDLAGAKTINVYAGTYTEGITLNSGLNTDATNTLTIQNNSGDAVIVDASGNNYGFDLNTVDYVTLKGFTVHSADLDNIYAQGNNVTIQYNQTYGSVGGSGIKVETGTPFTITNNLSYSNYNYGIEVNSSNNTIKNNTVDDNGHSLTGSQILTYSFSGSLSIPDNGCPSTVADATINVPDNITITNVRVLNMNITHTYDGDLEISLVHPDATSVDLCLSRGGSGDNFTNTNFDDAAGTAISAGSAPFTGTYTPESALSALDGKTANGDWNLRVCDGANQDVGTIDGWTLEITYTANSQVGAGLYFSSVTGNTVENNISVAKAGNDSYYALQSPGNSVSSQYNTYYTTNTNLFDYNGTQDNTGPMGTGDITSDPVFVGSGDYHIFSTNDSYHAGEWPPTTATAGTWTTDASDSPALDAGNPADAYANEPQSGGRINQGTYGNTVQASQSTTAVTLNWDGSTDNNWFDASNWTPAQVPLATDNVIIADVTNQPIINNSISNIAQCNNMTIDAGADITIDPDGYMTVSGSITNNAGNTGLVINSDDTGTGSLIQNTSGGVDATVYRRLSSTGRQWHMVASPITAAPLTVFPSTTDLYYYDENTADYWSGTTYGSTSVTGWKSPSGNMGVAQGYAFNYFATTLTYTGQLNDNTSTSAINVPYTNNGVNDPDGNSYDDSDGWNFIGNPFTSAIDWDDASVAHAAANLNDAVYTYDDTNLHNYTSYIGGTGTNGGSRYIPAMQGFFVKSDNTETGGTLNIGANARVHNTQSFWKSTYTTPDNFIRLQITAENGYTDETVVRFLDNATSEMDKDADAYKLFTWADFVPQIYTNAEGSTDYSINTLKTIETGDISIPLKTLQTGNKYTISVTEFNFNAYKVYLKDNLTNETVEIGLNDVFELTSDVSDNDNRFELVIEKSTSGIVLAENSTVSLYPNPNNGQFYLTVGNNRSNYTVSISNITGQVVYNNRFKGNTSEILDISNQVDGIYFVKITFSDYSSVTKKIVIQ